MTSRPESGASGGGAPPEEAFSFWKMAGGGNDFIVLDGLSRPLPSLPPGTIRRLCRRGVSIGADGVLGVVASSAADIAVRHWNADGGANAFCGNGTRCAARFAFLSGLAGRQMTVETGAGVLRAEMLESGAVRVESPAPRDARPGLRLSLEGGTAVAGDFVVVGVPHLVVEAEDLEALPIAEMGPPLRRHGTIGPEGANVHFVRVLEDGSVAIRSWERGVEGETLACGSGAVAAALWLRRRTGGVAPVRLRTRSEIELTVRIEGTGPEARVWLEGDARVVFRATGTEETIRGFPQ